MTVTALESVVGAEALTAPDAQRWAALSARPEVVAHPSSAEEAAAVLEWAGREGLGVVIAASGRRLRSRVIGGPFIGLVSDRLAGIEIYEPADVTFTAGAGTPMAAIDAALRPNRQWLPFDPPAVLDRTLGGLVASGESGSLWMGFGPIRNHVLGMTVATGDGRVLRLGGRVVKNVAGFDLIKPMVGSRGRLAFITSVCMRAFPEAAAERILTYSADVDAALGAALAVGTAPVMPVSTVLRVSSDGRAELVVRLQGPEATVEADRATLRHAGVEMTVAAAAPPEVDESADLVVVEATVLPSRLAEAVAAARSTGPSRLVIDSYAARLRIGFAEPDTSVLTALRSGIESLGGAVSIERCPVDADTIALGSRPNADERTLAARVAGAFDPHRVLGAP